MFFTSISRYIKGFEKPRSFGQCQRLSDFKTTIPTGWDEDFEIPKIKKLGKSTVL